MDFFIFLGEKCSHVMRLHWNKGSRQFRVRQSIKINLQSCFDSVLDLTVNQESLSLQLNIHMVDNEELS